MNIHHKLVTVGLILGIAIAITSSHGEVRQNIHRAYEPASMALDINLQGGTLSLFLYISPEAAAAITRLPLVSLASHLQEFTPLITLPADAQCRQLQKQFLVEPTDTPYPGAESLLAPHSLKEINGYLEYECHTPENLSHLIFLGFKAIPDLKHTSVWLISDNWQNKQHLSQEYKEVQLKKQPRKRGFLNFFND
ncbi:hypothetical protein [Endozoicomonas sp. ONNA2]|uniref:ZrgA family zinc uptake protein n=1 Tax=Endozoicomonas sp. ONNA2 TaxID=2828741 RepID=UPI002148162A|nr:hypothetical protein [Endozoicomonas sp. ONNA2]